MTMQQQIQQRLEQDFAPLFVEVLNESYMHNVAEGSESHFKVTLVSEQFDSLMLIKRHRLVNQALSDEIKAIHALALHTLTPQEWFDKGGSVADSPQCMGGSKADQD